MLFPSRFRLPLLAAALAATSAFGWIAPPAGAAGYKVVDYGHPKTYNWGPPIAFNDTGQIVGYADVGNYGFILPTRCIAFTGKAFIDITPPQDNDCQPTGVSDSIGGLFKVVGSLQDDTSVARQGFVATVAGNNADMDVFEILPAIDVARDQRRRHNRPGNVIVRSAARLLQPGRTVLLEGRRGSLPDAAAMSCDRNALHEFGVCERRYLGYRFAAA